MVKTISSLEFKRIKSDATFLSTAAERKHHQSYFDKFEFFCGHLPIDEPYARNLISELIANVQVSFGRVKDKDHWVKGVQQTLYKLERFVGD